MNNLWFNRFFENSTDTILKKGKVFVLEGPRRVGKTELVNKMLRSFNGKIFSGTGDDMLVRETLSSQNLHTIIANFKSYDLTPIFTSHNTRIIIFLDLPYLLFKQ